jgi:hypothetical protein
MYKLRDWVDESNLTHSLSLNERAVEYLENNELLIDDDYILRNINAIHIIEKRIKLDKYGDLNRNKNMMNFLRNNRKYIRYFILSVYEHGVEFVDEALKKNELNIIYLSALYRNPALMHILNEPKYFQYINWKEIIRNNNAVEFVRNNLHMVDEYWNILCEQPHLIDIIEQNMDKIDWCGLSGNYNAIHILEKNINKINDRYLCRNKNGFSLLLQIGHVFNDNIFYEENVIFEYFDYCEKNNIPFNLTKYLSKYGYTEKHIDFLKLNNHYWYLSMNPNIFEYDYKRMRETRQSLRWYNDIKK